MSAQSQICDTCIDVHWCCHEKAVRVSILIKDFCARAVGPKNKRVIWGQVIKYDFYIEATCVEFIAWSPKMGLMRPDLKAFTISPGENLAKVKKASFASFAQNFYGDVTRGYRRSCRIINSGVQGE
jgi:hypothetical protein